MNKSEYLILRKTTTGGPRSPIGLRTRTESDSLQPVSLRLDAYELGPEEVGKLRENPEVESIAPPMPLKLVAPCKRADAKSAGKDQVTWGVRSVGAVDCRWNAENVLVAILDSGIDAHHPAFKGLNAIERDFTGEGDGDMEGHGTHCAGTIFGRDTEGLRIGVAPSVSTALIGKVLGVDGAGTTKALSQAIVWALEQGAHIVTMSLGIDFPGYVKALIEEDEIPSEVATSRALEAYRETIRFFDRLSELAANPGPFGPGALLIAATGNESRRNGDRPFAINVSPPAAALGVIAVAALERADRTGETLRVAPFSNTGANVAAPGVDIFSAKPGGGYQEMTGTSMAAPHVAGVAALWAAKMLKEDGEIDARQLSSRMIGSAKRSRAWSKLDVGAGIVQAPPAA